VAKAQTRSAQTAGRFGPDATACTKNDRSDHMFRQLPNPGNPASTINWMTPLSVMPRIEQAEAKMVRQHVS
jgi:hypothetical protein